MAVKKRVLRWLQKRTAVRAEMIAQGYAPVTFWVIPSRSVELLVHLQKIGAKEVRQDFTGKVVAMCQQQHINAMLADHQWPEFDYAVNPNA